MAKIIVHNNVTLDSVMQAPGRPDEDERDGFTHGGWALPYADATAGRLMAESSATTGGLLLGRRTYEDFYSVWPKRTDGNPFTSVLNNATKYVASTTLREPLPWENSRLLSGDAADAVAGLRAREEKDIVILGSGALIQSLARRNLIDRYVLLIHPLVLGSGHRLFPDGAPYATLRLVSATPTPTGVIVATYEPAETVSA
ncbi:MAG TPA: dihydrofolate reductase family protein [Ktedonobacterales bacterium]